MNGMDITILCLLVSYNKFQVEELNIDDNDLQLLHKVGIVSKLLMQFVCINHWYNVRITYFKPL